MASALKTRNPLILFEGNANAVSKPVARNPITGGDQSFQPSHVSRKPTDRNPILQSEANPVMRASLNINNKPARNPIVADKNEFAIKGNKNVNNAKYAKNAKNIKKPKNTKK